MNKVANDKQVMLCKQAAVDRFMQYGVNEKTASDLFDAILVKMASPWDSISKAMLLGGAGGGTVGLLNQLLTSKGNRKVDEEPEKHRRRVIGGVAGPAALGATTIGALAAFQQLVKALAESRRYY